MLFIIYKTTNLINGRYYIGAHSTNNIEDNYLGSGTLIRNAIKLYGRENFAKEILFTFDNAEDMYNKERELIDEDLVHNKETYNLMGGGLGGSCIISERTRKRLSESHMGQSRKLSMEHRRKIGESNKGKKRSKKDIQRNSETHKGKIIPEETRKKMSASLKGRKVSKETRDKISKSHMGKTISKETREKLSNCNKGKITVKYANDLEGKAFIVPKDDPRFHSGELITAQKAYHLRKKLQAQLPYKDT